MINYCKLLVLLFVKIRLRFVFSDTYYRLLVLLFAQLILRVERAINIVGYLHCCFETTVLITYNRKLHIPESLSSGRHFSK